jgi:predicted RNase H-like nuclease
VGLDGCSSGWVAVHLRDGCVEDVAVVDRVVEALERFAPSHVGIDMPVGLVDAARDTDAAARRLLPGRGATVFATAPRTVVAGWRAGTVTTHAAADTVCREVLMGTGLSQQAWRLVPKMAEVDDLAHLGAPLVEVHPELAFATIVGEPLPRKRSWSGLARRRRLLEELGVVLPDDFLRAHEAAPDDVVDAAVCAWVADGLAGAPGQVTVVPESTAQHAHGRPIVITVRQL